jgi:hypothetical protein
MKLRCPRPWYCPHLTMWARGHGTDAVSFLTILWCALGLLILFSIVLLWSAIRHR